MGMRKPAGSSPLRDAAEALDRELERYGALAAELQREPVTSEKSLRRSARLLQGLSETEELLGLHVAKLVGAIDGRRRQQEATVAEVHRLAEAIRGRTALFQDLLARCDALARKAAEANVALQQRAASGADDDASLVAFEATATGLDELVEEARAIGAVAHEGGFEDVARQTEGLRAQLASARQKLLAMCERVRQGRVVH